VATRVSGSDHLALSTPPNALPKSQSTMLGTGNDNDIASHITRTTEGAPTNSERPRPPGSELQGATAHGPSTRTWIKMEVSSGDRPGSSFLPQADVGALRRHRFGSACCDIRVVRQREARFSRSSGNTKACVRSFESLEHDG
jgi:hypothetical protein